MLSLVEGLQQSGITTTLGIVIVAFGLAIIFYTFLKSPTTIQRLQKIAPEKSSKPQYATVFPPVQREVLTEIAPKLSFNGSSTLDLSELPVLSLDADYRLAEPWRYNFSGYSVGEIRALGDFPDYAKLSGVPLPKPLHDFNIHTAVARPYRPFRWEYHQTMCMYQ